MTIQERIDLIKALTEIVKNPVGHHKDTIAQAQALLTILMKHIPMEEIA